MRLLISLAAAGLALTATHVQAQPAGPPSLGDPSKNPDMTKFAAEVDTNHDGKLSRTEWEAQGLPASSFKMFEKGRGYVTLEDYQTHAAPPGIDINGDGFVTVAEFKEFDRKGPPGKKGPPPK
jgi:hypothetical protein